MKPKPSNVLSSMWEAYKRLGLAADYHTQQNKDKWHVIKADNITVAQGLKCSICNLVRPPERISCVCRKEA